jgi:MoxR-like ATPase
MAIYTNDIRKTPLFCERILQEVGRAVVGKKEVLQKIMAAFLAGGHVLLEDYPGVAKTLMANSFARALGVSFRRIQCTPDLLPGDITGGYIHDRERNEFVLRKGPVFANIVLADEINRASPRTQSALLEAMQEGQVTLEGETLPLPEPFLVIATQNPIEYEGTFPLPEAQLDRFLLKLSVGYPTMDEEREILRRRRDRRREGHDIQAAASAEELLDVRSCIENVFLDDCIEEYIVHLVHATRQRRQVAVGSSPRGALALMKLARTRAAMEGRDFVLPDDVKEFVFAALGHRVILRSEYWSAPHVAESVLSGILDETPVPVLADARS